MLTAPFTPHYPPPYSREWHHHPHSRPPLSENSINGSWYENTNNKKCYLIDSQTKLMNMFETVSQHIGELEKAVTNMQSASSSTGGSREEKQCIPPNLSKTVAMIHEALEEDGQFKPNLRAKDEHNKKVKKVIEEEISLQKENAFSNVLIERAFQRYFESRRRTWRETSDPKQQVRVAKQAKSRRNRSWKLRATYDDGTEKENFMVLSLDFMSAESSGEEGGPIKVHKPEWRSNKLTQFLHELDKRVSDKKESIKYSPERKERKDDGCFSSVPPLNAPKWTIDKEWLKNHPEFQTAEAS